jgi:hypothetical protein
MERHTGGRAVRALGSPAAIALGAAGAGVSAATGAEGLAIAGIGAVLYGVGAAATALLRRGGAGRRRERIDPFTVGEPWRQRVQAALSAQQRYEQVVRGTQPGPLRERLVDIGDRIAAGVDECWRIAQQGHGLTQGMRTLRIGDIRRDLAAAESAAGPAAGEDQRVTALRAQLGSAERMEATAADADARLTLLTARLDEAAARAVELSLGAGTDADVAGLGSEVDEVVDQLEALRLALGEVGG